MWTFGKKIAGGFVVSSVLLIGIGIVAYRGTDSLAATSIHVTHTHQVLDHVASVLSLMKDAETGQRGFVITGDDAFLEPYNSAIAALPATVKELRALTADNRSQQTRLDETAPLIAGKLAELARTIALRRASG